MSRSDPFSGALMEGPSPMCDDCVAEVAGWASRQSAYSAGSSLAKDGGVLRAKGPCARCGRHKTVSWVGDARTIPVADAARPADDPGEPAVIDRPWHWEGNVQAVLASYLATQGYQLRQVIDTASKLAGVDIIAERGTEILWVTVKGYPVGTARTNAGTQSRHWFSHALFDVVRYRTEQPDIDIGVGLPDGFTSYLKLAPKVAWLKETAPFRFFWVAEEGGVRVE